MELTGAAPDAVPFAADEYRGRAAKVREEMAARGIDVLVVLRPANIVYLTGYSSIWYPTRVPLGVALCRGDPQIVLLDWVRHEDFVRRHAFFDELSLFAYVDAAPAVAAALRERGWAAGTVGLEWSSPVPDGPVVAELARSLEETGTTVVDGDWLVDHVRLVKSAAELERLRRAARAADDAFAALPDVLRPGMTEREVAGHLDLLLARAGGETPACPAMVSAGPLAWCRNHAFPSARLLEHGDTVYVDVCGVVDRYHANLCRTFVLGPTPPGAAACVEVAAGSVDALRRSSRPGEPLEIGLREAEAYVHGRLSRDCIWWVGGYALGIAQPPSWVGHAYLSNDAHGPPLVWRPGMVFNFENVFFDREEGSVGATIDTVLMTETGLEVLSRLPHELLAVDA